MNLERRRRLGPVMMEVLARRALLSSSLTDGVLTVAGTEHDDRLTVAASPFVNALVVDDNGQAHYYALSAVNTIKINGGGGDDRISMDGSLAGMRYACLVDGGTGNDILNVAGGKVTVNGGNGNDRIRTVGALVATVDSGNGNNWVQSGSGNDLITCRGGNDWVDGGDGADTVTDSFGHDTLRGGAGNDIIKSFGTATVNGGEGADMLFGNVVYGGGGNDSIYGLTSADYLRGEAGDDLILGRAGADTLVGDTGGDALFGGADSDSLNGGAGNDNLYGGDGYKDKNLEDDGHDTGMGGAGADWLDPVHVWRKVDYGKSDNPGQNKLGQDSNVGHYASGAGVQVIGAVTGGAILTITGSQTRNSTIDGTLVIGSGGSLIVNQPATDLAPAVKNKSLGAAGWLSSGAWDEGKAQFVPPVLADSERAAVKGTIVQLPRDWQVGEMSVDGGLVWYRVTRSASLVTVPATWPGRVWNGEKMVPGYMKTNVSAIVSAISLTGSGTISGTDLIGSGGMGLVPAEVTPNYVLVPNDQWAVPTVACVAVNVPKTTAGLFDGVEAGAYRFLAVKAGSVIVSRSTKVGGVKQRGLDTKMVALPTYGDVRIGGQAAVHQLVAEFAHVPLMGKGARGILVEDGAVVFGIGNDPAFVPA